VSAHPAFPAIVALWFAVLLGLGSLVVPVQALERLVAMIGIANFLPAAAPPLGPTARIVIALVAALFGAGLGFVAARRMNPRNAQARADQEASFEEEEDACTLDLAGLLTSEVASEGEVEAEKAQPQDTKPLLRRRQLTIVKEDGPDDLLIVAPLPGDITTDAGHDHNHDVENSADFEPLDEYEQESEEPPVQMAASFENLGGEDEDGDEDELAAEDEDEIAADADAKESHRDDVTDPLAPVEITQGAVPPAETDEAGPQPLHFSPPSLARTADGEDCHMTSQCETGLSDEDAHHSEELAAMPHSLASEAPGHQDMDHACADREERAADPGELGLAQLVERLGSVLEEHRTWSAKRAAAQQTPAAIAEAEEIPVEMPDQGPAQETPAPTFTPAAREEAADAMAAYFSRPSTSSDAGLAEEEPAQVELAANEAEHSEDDPPLVYRSPTSTALPAEGDVREDGAVAVAAEPADAPVSPDRDASYRSLSAVDNPFRPKDGEPRADAKPAPTRAKSGTRARARADNDETLRAALRNLQHMAD